MLRQLLIISRPRFWIYLVWPYLVGSVAAWSWSMDISRGLFFVRLIYFIRPANLLIYWVNDLYDWDTDFYNPKKNGYEQKISGPEFSFYVKLSIFKRNVPWLLASFFMFPVWALVALGIFVLLGIWYSMPPMRFKVRPWLDSFSNILYIVPWIVGYFVMWWLSLDWMVIIGACLRAMSMHAYSAIPDIAADTKAWLATIATVCGRDVMLAICRVWYMLAAMLARHAIGWYSVWWAIVYSWMIVWSYYSRSVFTVYRRFPIVNMLVGFGLFWWIVMMKW